VQALRTWWQAQN